MKSRLVVLFIIILVFSGCKRINRDPYANTPTSGRIKICIDETFRKIMEAELDVFQSLYTYSSITPTYTPEKEAFKQLLSDSVNLIIASRYLKDDEIKLLNSKKLYPKQTKVAVDAIALIVNPSNPDTVLSLNQIKQIFTGRVSKWEQLKNSRKKGDITIVFDNKESSILRFVVDSICREQPLTTKAYAMEYNRDVIDYVGRNPQALGLIGVSWISDRDDSTQLSFLKEINVVSVNRDSLFRSESYKPFQAYMLQGLYPFVRDIVVINTEPSNGLCTGLASFIAGDKGQRILLKSGVLPSVAPTRLVNIRDNI